MGSKPGWESREPRRGGGGRDYRSAGCKAGGEAVAMAREKVWGAASGIQNARASQVVAPSSLCRLSCLRGAGQSPCSRLNSSLAPALHFQSARQSHWLCLKIGPPAALTWWTYNHLAGLPTTPPRRPLQSTQQAAGPARLPLKSKHPPPKPFGISQFTRSRSQSPRRGRPHPPSVPCRTTGLAVNSCPSSLPTYPHR